MKVQILGLSPVDSEDRQYLTTFVINGTVAIDAGCVGLCGTPQAQSMVRNVFLTHSHADHIASLPVFIENAYSPCDAPPVVYGSRQTLEAVQQHIFNDIIWPDFVGLSTRTAPFLQLRTLEAENAVEVEGLRILPVNVNHTVPTFAYIVDDGEVAIIFAADSGPTERLWSLAHQTRTLQVVFLEATFPNSMHALADKTRHLTPRLFAAEVKKMPPSIRIIAVHMKTRWRAAVVEELSALCIPGLEIGSCVSNYAF
jgi:ribonuclease BN (tRNA processing enzyme)